MTQVLNNLKQFVSDLTPEGVAHPPMKDNIKGLGILISDIRRCKSKEAEKKRVNKELANIRSKFKGDKILNGYQKKKYIAKLLFMFLLGYNIDFGHMEAINLLSSARFSEKSIGYMFITVVFTTDNEFMQLLIAALRNDLKSPADLMKIIALQAISNILCTPIAEALGHEVSNLLLNYTDLESPILPSALPCFLSLIRLNPSFIPSNAFERQKIIDLLKCTRYSTYITCLSLLEELASSHPEDYKDAIGNVVTIFSRIVDYNSTIERDKSEHTFYGFYMPWMLVKCIKFLRLYPLPEDEINKNIVLERISKLLSILGETNKSKRSHYLHTKYSILFELIPLMIHYDINSESMYKSCNVLMHPLNTKDSNLRGLALRCLIEMSGHENSMSIVEKLTQNVLDVINSELDMDVRKIGVDVAYSLCNSSNVMVIVTEILKCLSTCEYNVKAEMTLKVAILAEKYSTDAAWYVESILRLMYLCGEHVSEDVWFRLIQVVTNKEEVQGHAAQKAFEYLQLPDLQENMIKVTSYILGEFGNLIANDQRSSPEVQFNLLQGRFPFVSVSTKYLMLSTFAKMRNLFPEIKSLIEDLLKNENLLKNCDVEIQQRTVEILTMSTNCSSDLLATVFEVMPPYVDHDNALLDILKQKSPSRQLEQSKPSTDSFLRTAAITTTSHATRTGNSFSETSEPGSDVGVKSFILGSSGVVFRNEMMHITMSIDRDQPTRGSVKHQWVISNVSRYNISNVSVNINKSLGFSITSSHLPYVQSNTREVLHTLIQCSQEFSEAPVVMLVYSVDGSPKSVEVVLPLFLHHFMNPVTMTPQDYFSRWHNLGGPHLEHAVTSTAPLTSMESGMIEDIFTKFNLQTLDGVDPNPNNTCASAILNTGTSQVGVLLRLESKKPERGYKLTIRASKGSVSRILCGLLAEVI